MRVNPSQYRGQQGSYNRRNFERITKSFINIYIYIGEKLNFVRVIIGYHIKLVLVSAVGQKPLHCIQKQVEN